MSTSISFASGGSADKPDTPTGAAAFNWAVVWRIEVRRAVSGIQGDIDIRPSAWGPARGISGQQRTISSNPELLPLGGVNYNDLPEDHSWAVYTARSTVGSGGAFWDAGVHNGPSIPLATWLLWIETPDTEPDNPSGFTISAPKKRPLRRRGRFSRCLHTLLKGK